MLKKVRKTAAGNLTSKVNTQGAVICYVWSEVLRSSKNAWFAVQSNLSRNLHNFTVRYQITPYLISVICIPGDWLKQNCAHCAITFNLCCMEFAGCAESLDRYTWRHDSVLNYIATFLERFARELYADVTNSAHQALSPVKKCDPTCLSSWTGRKCS